MVRWKEFKFLEDLLPFFYDDLGILPKVGYIPGVNATGHVVYVGKMEGNTYHVECQRVPNGWELSLDCRVCQGQQGTNGVLGQRWVEAEAGLAAVCGDRNILWGMSRSNRGSWLKPSAEVVSTARQCSQ
eukprot:417686-Ditylum_brightwellii.AAC.1